LEISLFRIDVPPASGDDVTARIDTLLADRLVSGDPDQAAAAIAQELVANSPPRPGS
jgi:hypothetical protein